MVIEDERQMNVHVWRPLPNEHIAPPNYSRQGDVLLAHMNARIRHIRSRATNHDLQNDLMDHLWNRYGNEDE